MASNDSNVMVRLRLVGQAAFAAGTKAAATAMDRVDGAGRRGAGGLDRAADATTRTERAMARLYGGGGGSAERTLMAVGRAATVAAGAVAVAGGVVGRMAWDYNANQDAQAVSFTALLGSREKAAKLQREILDLAKESPILDPKSTGDAVRMLMAYGIEVDKVIPLTRSLGDMSAASGKAIAEVMPRAALALGQIEGKGRLQAQEMNQLAESVGLSRKAIRRELGMTAEEFEATFQPGKNIKSSEAIPAIMRAMTRQSAGAADDLAKTTAGRLDRAKEVISQQAGELTRPLYDAIGVGATKGTEWLESNGGKIKSAVGGIASGIGDVASQIITALEPARPFVENVIMPLVQGIAEGVGGAVVGAFRIVLPIIGTVAKALGAIGTAAAPLRPVIRALGQVLGVVFGPWILKALGQIPKLGVVFRIVAIPIRLLIGVLRGVWRVIGSVASGFVRAFTSVSRFVGTFTSAPARVARAALNIVGGIIRRIETLPSKLIAGGRAAITGLVTGLLAIGGKVLEAGKIVGGKIVDGIKAAIKAAAGAIKDAVMSVVPGPARKALGLAGDALGAVGLATGGTVRRTGWAVVGERGPELAHLEAGTTVYDHVQTARVRDAAMPMSAASASIYLHNVMTLDGRTVHESVRRVERDLQELAA